MKDQQTQKDDPTKLEISFHIDNVTFPFGRLIYQKISLLKLNDNLHPIANESDTSSTSRTANFHDIIKVKNVLRKMAYKPVYEYKVEVDKSENQGYSRLILQCDGPVSVVGIVVSF